MRTYLLIGMVALLGACSKQAPAPAPAQTEASAPAPAQTGTSAQTSAPPQTPTPAQAPTPAPVAPAANLLSDQGIGPVRFGMTLAQAEQAVGAKATLPQPFDPACSMVRFAALPDLRFMVENGVVTRADAGASVATALGVAHGDTLEQIRRSHPEAQVSAHKYDPKGAYVSFPGADGKAALILELKDGKVAKMRAGLQPAVGYVESCG